MNISGLVIHARPAQADAVHSALRALPGVEVHARGVDGRFIITLEDSPEWPAADAFVRLRDIPGVLSAAVVYEQSADIP